jgi:hypothetical protein
VRSPRCVSRWYNSLSPSRGTPLGEVQVAERGCRPRPRSDDHQGRADGRPISKRHARRHPGLPDETRDGLATDNLASQGDHARRQHFDAASSEGPARVQVEVPRDALERGASLDVVREDRAHAIFGVELDRAHAESDVVGVCLRCVEPLVLRAQDKDPAPKGKDRRGKGINMSGFGGGWDGILLSVRVAPFVGPLPFFDSIPSQLPVKYIGIGRAHDCIFSAAGRKDVLSSISVDGERARKQAFPYFCLCPYWPRLGLAIPLIDRAR